MLVVEGATVGGSMVGTPPPGSIVAASTPPGLAALPGELGVSNSDVRIRVPQPAQNSPSGGIARPHLLQKEAESMSVIWPE